MTDGEMEGAAAKSDGVDVAAGGDEQTEDTVKGCFMDGIIGCSVPEGISYVVDRVCAITSLSDAAPAQPT